MRTLREPEEHVLLHLLEDVEEVVDFLAQHGITFDEFMLCYLLYIDGIHHTIKGRYIQEKGSPAIANLYKYIYNVKKWSIQEIDRLMEKGLIIDDKKRGDRDIYPDNLKVSDVFIDRICSTMDSFDEFWDAYPAFIDNFQDKRKPKIPLKAQDMDDVEKLYARTIKSKKAHDRMIKVLEWAKENDQIRTNIKNWLGIWRDMEEEMKKKGSRASRVGQREA